MGRVLRGQEQIKITCTMELAHGCRILVLFPLILLVGTCLAQVGNNSGAALSFNELPISFVKGNFSHFEIDRLGNVFTLGTSRQITKYNKLGDSTVRYDNVRSYGEVSQIDVSNPLKIAVFYRDFAKIVALDRYLSPVNSIDLGNAGIWEITSVATSYDNQYWIFDRQEAKIKKIDGKGVVNFASSDLRQVFDRDINFVKLIDMDGLLYCYDSDLGWYIFDYYGALNQKIEISHLVDLQVTNGLLTGRLGDSLWLVSTKDLMSLPIWLKLPKNDEELRQIYFDPSKSKLWVLLASGIYYFDVHVK